MVTQSFHEPTGCSCFLTLEYQEFFQVIFYCAYQGQITIPGATGVQILGIIPEDDVMFACSSP